VEMNINGTQIAVKEYGTGQEHCLLLHGNRDRKEVFESLANQMAEKYHIVTMDYRGHGQSKVSISGYDYSQFVADIDAVLEALDMHCVNMIGHSLGGVLAVLYQQKYPKKVKQLVLLGTSPYFKSSFQRQKRGEAITPQKIKETNEAAEPYFFSAGHEQVKKFILANWEQLPAYVHEKMIAMGHTDISPLLEKIMCRVLLVIGDLDKICTIDTAEEMKQKMKEARLAVIKDADHYMFMEKPLETAQQIQLFLEDSGKKELL